MISVQTQGFDSEGITLTGPVDSDFEAQACTVLDCDASPILGLTPFLAIVRNGNPRTVVAYTVSWMVTHRNETTEISHTQFQYPDAVAGTVHGVQLLERREIPTGGERLVGLGFEVWPPEYLDSYLDFGRIRIAELGEVMNLRISLDAVILDDGTLLGPDESHLAEHFIAFVQAKQAIYREVVLNLENGRAGDDAFAALRAVRDEKASSGQVERLYGQQATVEALLFHDRVVLDVFRRALRREPFSIHRPRFSGTHQY